MYFELNLFSLFPGVYATAKVVVAMLFSSGQSGTTVSIIHAPAIALLGDLDC